MPRAYCVVYGCLNSASTKSERSFFKLPSDAERRSKWLSLIFREDLIDKPPKSYAVCQDHFDPLDVMPGAQRNKLKRTALPSRKLPKPQIPLSSEERCREKLKLKEVRQQWREAKKHKKLQEEEEMTPQVEQVEKGTEDPLAVPENEPSSSKSEGTMKKNGVEALTPRVLVAQSIKQMTPAASPPPAKKAKLTPAQPSGTILRNTLQFPRKIHTDLGDKILAAATTIREPKIVCCVFGCRNNELEHPELKFFKFPNDQTIISRWLNLFNRKDREGKLRGVTDCRICSSHFDESDYILGELGLDAVPRYHLPKKSSNIVFASYSAPAELQIMPEVKIEGEDSMDVETHFQPEAPPTTSSIERIPRARTPILFQPEAPPTTTSSKREIVVIIPRSRTPAVCSPSVTQSRSKRAKPKIAPEIQMPSIVRVESYNDLAPAFQKQKLKEAFLKKATVCAIEQIDLVPPPPETASVHVQTTKKLLDLMNVVMVKKFKGEINEAKRKLKLYERQLEHPKINKTQFMALCDKYMDEKIANIVKSHACLNDKSKGSRYSRKFKAFALNLYLCSPQSYKLIEQFFCLPSVNTIKRFQMPVRPGVNPHLIDALKVKVSEMSEKEKICTVCFDYMEVNKNLFYDVTNDALWGIQDIDQVISSEPARYALLIMVRGLYTKWKQPVSYALVSHKVFNPLVKEWLHKIINLLFDLRLNVKAFTADMETAFLDFSEVSAPEPYFEVGGRKIYHIFDVPSLFKSARDDLMQYNFHFGLKVVKWSHILKVCDADAEEELPLMPKITANHLEPDDESKNDAKLAIQLFSRSVAAAMNFHVVANMVDKKMKDTIEFITTMNNLFDVMNSPRISSGDELKQTYKATAQQVKFLQETLEYLQLLEIKDKAGNAVEKRMTFVTGLVITIKSLMSLLDDLNKVYLKEIATKRLRKDCTDVIFRRVREMVGSRRCVRPTSVMFARGFRRLFLVNLVSDAKKGGTEMDMKSSLAKISDYVKSDLVKGEYQDYGKSLRVGVSDHHMLWPIPSTSFITGYLIWKCIENHTCQKMVESLCIDCNLESSAELLLETFKAFKPANMKKKLPEPPQFLVEFVEKLDVIYNGYYKSSEMQWYGFGWNVYLAMENETFDLPCECFPLKFFKMFFIRVKIFHTVKEYNRNNRLTRRRQKV